ncbi:MAG: thiolase family protein [Clostridiales Family XIII bacterium]|nr:thiolase family protein [Clostridiales Family XIII bacterium]
MRNAVIAACGRSAIGKAPKGALRDTRSDDIGATVLRGVLARARGLNPEMIDDFILGCAFPEAEQGCNVSKIVSSLAGLPACVPAQTVNRFCASGLQSVAAAANAIMAGQADAVAAGGIESMSMIPMGGNLFTANPRLMESYPDPYMAMGITAENVAEKYGVTREAQDEFAYDSHMKAAAAQRSGLFDAEIIPVEAVRAEIGADGKPIKETKTFVKDEGIRATVTLEGLAALKPVFKRDGSVTAGNASQMSDGAAMTVLMSEDKARKLGVKPLARIRSFSAVGVDPALMGIGPAEAIPKALKIAGLDLKDIQLIELNEAFASQSVACIKELGLNPKIVNVNGGAIALGHPLGCTGSLLLTKLLYEMERRGNRFGLVSMCVGGGMGAAAVFERM